MKNSFAPYPVLGIVKNIHLHQSSEAHIRNAASSSPRPHQICLRKGLHQWVSPMSVGTGSPEKSGWMRVVLPSRSPALYRGVGGQSGDASERGWTRELLPLRLFPRFRFWKMCNLLQCTFIPHPSSICTLIVFHFARGFFFLPSFILEAALRMCIWKYVSPCPSSWFGAIRISNIFCLIPYLSDYEHPPSINITAKFKAPNFFARDIFATVLCRATTFGTSVTFCALFCGLFPRCFLRNWPKQRALQTSSQSIMIKFISRTR
ncbi:hypothetical protein EDC01DRAFT_491309 [Geopyxis carbonaria]|nr:hypothetical protein EDC01DRAFT_491309 [Geopyxis carbonaria]